MAGILRKINYTTECRHVGFKNFYLKPKRNATFLSISHAEGKYLSFFEK